MPRNIASLPPARDPVHLLSRAWRVNSKWEGGKAELEPEALVVCAGGRGAAHVALELFLRGVLGNLWGNDTFSIVLEARRRCRHHGL